jgi:hypothetical protein
MSQENVEIVRRVFEWTLGEVGPGGIVRVTHGTHINEARAAAERLAEDRG